MTDLLNLIIGGLATYRLSKVFVDDQILNGFRNLLWRRFPPETNKFGYLFTCMWCMSIWTASLIVVSSIIIPTITLYVSLVLALSAIAGLLAAYESKD
jgi:hypothetical protein